MNEVLSGRNAYDEPVVPSKVAPPSAWLDAKFKYSMTGCCHGCFNSFGSVPRGSGSSSGFIYIPPLIRRS